MKTPLRIMRSTSVIAENFASGIASVQRVQRICGVNKGFAINLACHASSVCDEGRLRCQYVGTLFLDYFSMTLYN
jgi:hypothetical protein